MITKSSPVRGCSPRGRIDRADGRRLHVHLLGTASAPAALVGEAEDSQAPEALNGDLYGATRATIAITALNILEDRMIRVVDALEETRHGDVST